MSRSPAKSGNAMAMKSSNEKWLSIVQSAAEKGEKEMGASSIVTVYILVHNPLPYQEDNSEDINGRKWS